MKNTQFYQYNFCDQFFIRRLYIDFPGCANYGYMLSGNIVNIQIRSL